MTAFHLLSLSTPPAYLEVEISSLKAIPLIERTPEDLFLLNIASQNLKSDPRGDRLELAELKAYEKPLLFLATARSYLKARLQDRKTGFENPATARDFRERLEMLHPRKNLRTQEHESIAMPELPPDLHLTSLWYIHEDPSRKGPIQIGPTDWVRSDYRYLTSTSYGLMRGPGSYFELGFTKAVLEVERQGQKREIEIAQITPLGAGIHYTFAYPFQPLGNVDIIPSITLGLGGLIFKPQYSDKALDEGYQKACDPLTGELISIEDIRKLRRNQMPHVRVNEDVRRIALCQAQEALNFYVQGKGEINFELSIRLFEVLTIGSALIVDYRRGNEDDLVRDIIQDGFNLQWKVFNVGFAY